MSQRVSNLTDMKKSQTLETVQAWLVSQLALRLGVDPQDIDIRTRFSSYGLDSVGATGLVADLAAALECSLLPTLVWDYPTIAALARHIAGVANKEPSYPGLQTSRQSKSEPVAIIGLACRFPGANNAGAFWQLLRDGVDAITEVPAERWDIDAFYNADRATLGKMNTRWGGFLDQVDQFEPHFFGISPREALEIDPQQRLMLELSWEALEDAGLPTIDLKGSQTGVFVGAMWSDYSKLLKGEPKYIAEHTATGQDLSIIAARISYTLGLQGPSIAVNTACSSALVAVHLACQSLHSGESTLALAGGVNLMLVPGSTVAMSKFGGLSPDGRSKAFDALANGYVRGEGAGVVVLKPLTLALAAGDPIYCVIKGSAVNNDGFSNGLTAPNPQAQEAVLRQAYERAGVMPSKVHYVEAHGTGTILGDPIEAKALGAILGRDRPRDQPLILGSVKTNIGHLEAAAGVAGLIKVALAIKQRQIPPSLHFQQPNPYIPFDDLRLTVQQSLGAWPHSDEPALAGVSSFGFGGTNCHIVLEERPTRPVLLLPLSAESPEALKSLAREFQAQMASLGSRQPLFELCTLAALRLSHGAYRLALSVRSHEELAGQLNSFLQGAGCRGLSVDHHDLDAARKIVFVFSGQGSGGFGMGQQLLEQEPVFRAALERCDQVMRQYVNWSLLEELTANEAQSQLAQIDVMWPVLFAIEVALAALWRSWGIKPDAVVGHSLGEVAAAYVAGALSLEDAVRVVYHQSRLVKRLSGQGAMALVELSWEQAQQALVGYDDRLCLAISSSPTSTVLSGEPAALAEVLNTLQRRNIFCRFVKTDVAVHSAQIDCLQAELASALFGLQPLRASVPIISSLTACGLDGYQFDVSYWVRHLREPVLFADAIAQLLHSGHDIFLELSPHPILGRSIAQSLTHYKRQGTVLASLRLEEDSRAVMLDALGVLYTLGLTVHWHQLYPKPLSKYIGFSSPAHLRYPAPPARPALFLLSAHTKDALLALAQATLSLLLDQHDFTLHDLCYTVSLRRSHHDHRLAVVVHSQEELAEHLEAFVQGSVPPGMTIGRTTDTQKLVSVFSDQGSQWWTGEELVEEERAVMLESLGALYTLGHPVDWKRLYSDGGRYVRLPSYPWQRDRYWLEPAASSAIAELEQPVLPRSTYSRPKLNNAYVAPRNDIEQKIAAIWQQLLDIDQVGIQDNFFELGGDSLLAVSLFAQIKQIFNKNLPLATLFQSATVEQLASLLQQPEKPDLWSTLVTIQPAGSNPPLFCMGGAGGDVFYFRDLSNHLGLEQPVYGLQPQGLDGTQLPHTRIEDMALYYIKEMRTLQPEGPYFLGGHSAGGLVALEIAQQLQLQGQKVALLALFDVSTPEVLNHIPLFWDKAASVLINFIKFAPKQKMAYVLRILEYHPKNISEKIATRLGLHRQHSLPQDLSGPESLPQHIRQIFKLHEQAARDYVPQAYQGQVTLFKATEQPILNATSLATWRRYPLLGWERLAAGGVKVYEVPGCHAFEGSLLSEPYVRVLAKKLKTCLDELMRDS